MLVIVWFTSNLVVFHSCLGLDYLLMMVILILKDNCGQWRLLHMAGPVTVDGFTV